MVGDWPITKDRVDTKVYSDKHENIFELERDWPESFSPVREVNQLVVEVGEKQGVKTYIVAPPLICEFYTLSSSKHYFTNLSSRARNWLLHTWIWSGSYDCPDGIEEETISHDWTR